MVKIYGGKLLWHTKLQMLVSLAAFAQVNVQ